MICFFKAKSFTYLMIKVWLKLNSFSKAQEGSKICRILFVLGKISSYFFILQRVSYCWPNKPVSDCWN